MAITISQLRAFIGMDDAQFQAAVNRVVKGMDKMSKKAERAGQQLTLSVTAPLLALGGTAAKIAADFEQSMNVLQATSRATGDEMSSLSQLAKDLGADIDLPGTSANDAALAMTELVKGGLSVTDTMDAARSTLQLSAAAQIDNARAAEIVSDSLNQFALAGDQAARVADLLAGAADSATGTVDDMSFALQQSGASFSTLGVNINDAVTAIALMAKQGIKGQDAGTSLKAAMIQLAKPTTEAKKAMKDLGLAFFDANGQFVGLRSVAEQLQEKVGNLSEQERMRNLVVLAGTDGQRGLNALLKAGGEGFDTMSKAVGREGTAAAQATARNKGLAGAIDAMKSAFETAAQAGIEPIIGDLTKMARAAGEAIGSFAALSPETRKTILVILGLAAAIGPVLIAVGKFIGAIASLKAAIVAIKAAGGVVAFLGGPVTVAILGVVAVVTALALAWATNFGHIREVTFDVMNTIVNAVEIFGQGLSVAWEGIIDVLAGEWSEGWDKIKKGTSTALNSLSEGARKAGEERARMDKEQAEERVKLAKDTAKKVNAARAPDKDAPRTGGRHQDELDAERTKQLTQFKERLASTILRLRAARRGETQAAQDLAATFPLVNQGLRDSLLAKEAEIDKINETREQQKRYKEEVNAVNAAIRAMKDGGSVALAELARQYPNLTQAQIRFLHNQQQVRRSMEIQRQRATAIQDTLRQSRADWLASATDNKVAAAAVKLFGEEYLKLEPLLNDALIILRLLTPEQRKAAETFAEIIRKADLADAKKNIRELTKEAERFRVISAPPEVSKGGFGFKFSRDEIFAMNLYKRELHEISDAELQAANTLRDLQRETLGGRIVWEHQTQTLDNYDAAWGRVTVALDEARTAQMLAKDGSLVAQFAWEQFGVILDSVDEVTRQLIIDLFRVTEATKAMNELKQSFQNIFADAFANLKNGFKGFFQSIIRGVDELLTQIAAKFLAARLTEALFSAIPGGMDFLGGVVSGGQVGSRGIGGSGARGRPQIVGDRGPELFVPSNRGRFIDPKDTARMMAGGRTVVQNIHIHAADAQSVIKSRSTIAQMMYQAGMAAEARNG